MKLGRDVAPTAHSRCLRDPPRTPRPIHQPAQGNRHKPPRAKCPPKPGQGARSAGASAAGRPRRAPGQVGLALRDWSGSGSGGTAWVDWTEWGGHLHPGNRPRPHQASLGEQGPLRSPHASSLRRRPSPLGRSRTRQVRRRGSLADAAGLQSKPRPVSGLSPVSPGWGGARPRTSVCFMLWDCSGASAGAA